LAQAVFFPRVPVRWVERVLAMAPCANVVAMRQMQRRARERQSCAGALLVLSAAALTLCALLSPVFVAAPTGRASPSTFPSLRPRMVARRAEDGGFMSFLKVEQDLELSPEEYEVALQAEVEAQRKKYYIGGVVKEKNLVVPWKPVEEAQLIKDAKRTLKKNGIKDPNGPAEVSDESISIALSIVGEQDVRIEWDGGAPKDKVGYIVEKKRLTDANFQQIATYEDMATQYLLQKDYEGHDYTFTDDIVKPGSYTYRILVCRRTGEVSVVDTQDITMVATGDLSFGASLGILGVIVVVLFAGSYLADPPVQP